MLEKMMENHKILIAIPIILALLSLVLIGFNGLEQGVDLKGGSQAELQLLGSVTPSELEDTLDAKLNTNNIKVTKNGNESQGNRWYRFSKYNKHCNCHKQECKNHSNINLPHCLFT